MHDVGEGELEHEALYRMFVARDNEERDRRPGLMLWDVVDTIRLPNNIFNPTPVASRESIAISHQK